jgi:hypothetical protein
MSDRGFAEMDRMIASVRELGRAPSEVATIAAPLVSAEAKKTAAAGTTPAGEAWAPKKDGGRALENAAAAVSAVVVGDSVVQIRIDGTSTGSQKVQSLQHNGTGRIPARALIPKAGDDIPPGVSRALKTAATQFFKKTVSS